MTLYARPDPNQTGAIDARDLAAPPPAEKGWLALTIPAQPVPSATQVVVNAGITFTPTSATQQWALRELTADEIEAAALNAEKAEIDDRLTKLAAAVDQYQALLDVAYTEPVQAGTTAAEITSLRARMKVVERAQRDIWRDLILTMKAERFVLRRIRQQD